MHNIFNIRYKSFIKENKFLQYNKKRDEKNVSEAEKSTMVYTETPEVCAKQGHSYAGGMTRLKWTVIIQTKKKKQVRDYEKLENCSCFTN